MDLMMSFVCTSRETKAWKQGHDVQCLFFQAFFTVAYELKLFCAFHTAHILHEHSVPS